MCKKAIASYWTKLYGDDIKTKKTLKYLSVRGLCVGHSHLIWQNLDTVSAVRKEVIRASFLTGVYLHQLNRHMFSNKTVDTNNEIAYYVSWVWRIFTMLSHSVRPIIIYKH